MGTSACYRFLLCAGMPGSLPYNPSQGIGCAAPAVLWVVLSRPAALLLAGCLGSSVCLQLCHVLGAVTASLSCRCRTYAWLKRETGRGFSAA